MWFFGGTPPRYLSVMMDQDRDGGVMPKERGRMYANVDMGVGGHYGRDEV